MGAWFSGAVSLLALLIAATGIYGMLSYLVVERPSEIGIRMALGAQRPNVLLLIVSAGIGITASRGKQGSSGSGWNAGERTARIPETALAIKPLPVEEIEIPVRAPIFIKAGRRILFYRS